MDSHTVQVKVLQPVDFTEELRNGELLLPVRTVPLEQLLDGSAFRMSRSDCYDYNMEDNMPETITPGRMVYFTPEELCELEGEMSGNLAHEANVELTRRQDLGRLPDYGSPRWLSNTAPVE
jgi:hypothetical protein